MVAASLTIKLEVDEIEMWKAKSWLLLMKIYEVHDKAVQKPEGQLKLEFYTKILLGK